MTRASARSDRFSGDVLVDFENDRDPKYVATDGFDVEDGCVDRSGRIDRYDVEIETGRARA